MRDRTCDLGTTVGMSELGSRASIGETWHKRKPRFKPSSDSLS
jgi:hypothetical protein